MVPCGITGRFQPLFPRYGQIAHALLTRPPLMYCYTRSTCMC